ncbi:MAG: 5-oxoprolinase (ATP-hydrolyzing) subunit [Pseudonocardiales bacterium]|nr:5-oxoprolinase (ATP-hydrolyzing) subunit [Pseudonocardiales bacterium]
MTALTDADSVPRVSIDLNADLGEGFGAWRLGDDEALLDVVTSANVACGFHAGDPVTMQRVCAGAAERGVAVGAQVGYRDLAGFGRRRMDISPADLLADVLYQIGALEAFARAAGTRVRYVKPHGALYNTAADDAAQAGALAAAVAAVDAGLPLLGLPRSALADAAAAHGVGFVAEAFADRAYLPSGRLVPRSEPGAVLTGTSAVVDQAVSIARDGQVQANDGSVVTVAARSLCLHGDTPGAVALARAVRSALAEQGIAVGAFAS